MNDEELLLLLAELVRQGKLVSTMDHDGAPFYPVTAVTLSAALASETRRVILWIDDESPLDTIYE